MLEKQKNEVIASHFEDASLLWLHAIGSFVLLLAANLVDVNNIVSYKRNSIICGFSCHEVLQSTLSTS